MLRIFQLSALVLIISALCTAQPPLVVPGAWLAVEQQWQPFSEDGQVTTSQTEVLYIGKTGHFAVIDCIIYRKKSTFTVGAGDPHGVYLGWWHRVGSEVRASYRLTYQTIEAVGGKKREEFQAVPLKFAKDGTLVFNGKVFRRESGLVASVEEELREHTAHARGWPADK